MIRLIHIIRRHLALSSRNGRTSLNPKIHLVPTTIPHRSSTPHTRNERDRERRSADQFVASSRRSGGLVDGYKALRGLSLAARRRARCARSSAPTGPAKPTMMDVITGKTRPDTGDVYFEGRPRSDKPRRGRDRRARRRPQVPETDGVREPHRGRQSAAGRQGAARRFATLFGGAAAGRRDDRAHPRNHRPRRPCATRCRARCRTARNNGSRSACCSPRIPSCCWSTSRSPA